MGEDIISKAHYEVVDSLTSLVVNFHRIWKEKDILHAAMSSLGDLGVESQAQSHPNPHLQRLMMT